MPDQKDERTLPEWETYAENKRLKEAARNWAALMDSDHPNMAELMKASKDVQEKVGDFIEALQRSIDIVP